MKKVLFIANIHSHFKSFHLPYFELFKNKGWIVHALAGGEIYERLPFADKVFNTSICRTPFSVKNFIAYKEICQIINREKYDLVICHTPMGGVMGRLCSNKIRKNGAKIIYMVHGFHFFKGAPIVNWLFYFPMEKWLAHYTDAIITINQEDYSALKKYQFKVDGYLTHGIGVNINRIFHPKEEEMYKLRCEMGYRQNDFILVNIAAFIPRKNQNLIIEATRELKEKIPYLKVILIGDGPTLNILKAKTTSLGLEDTIKFKGRRNDIGRFLAIADVGISSSRQEGLPINIAEAMYAGLPIVASEDRGHRELVKDNVNGYLFPQNDLNAFCKAICSLYENPLDRKRMGKASKEIVKPFILDKVIPEIESVLTKYMP